jgi:hypothetical protein
MSGGGKVLRYDVDHDHVNIQLDSYKGYLEQIVMWES